MSLTSLQKYVYVLLAVILTFTLLYLGRDLFILIIASGIFAFLLLPLVKRGQSWGMPLWLSALISCLLLVICGLGVLVFVGWQISHFGNDLPQLQASLLEKTSRFQLFIEESLSISRRDQYELFQDQVNKLANQGSSYLLGFFSTTGAVIAQLVLIPIIVFLLLLYNQKFRQFFHLLGGEREGSVLDVMVKISVLSRKYLRGVLTVILIVATLNSIGFLALGLEYAILFGFLTALLNIIPYIGVLIGGLLPMILALITKDSIFYAIGVIAVTSCTQFLENNFITPKIVGSSVSINPLASIIALLCGGILWGVVGLILSIPVTGMVKIVCDAVPGLQPWGFLLGEENSYDGRKKKSILIMDDQT